MKNALKILGGSLLALAFLVPSFAYAVGSGSGGSPPAPQPDPTPPPVVVEPTPVVQPEPIPVVEPVTTSQPVYTAPKTTTPTKVTSAPATAPKAATCNSLGIRTERIMCRLQKDPAALAQEQAQEYLPEACRVAAAGSDERSDCIQRYESFFPCWDKPAGPERTACAKEALGLSALAPANQYCQGQSTACVTSYTQKIYRLINFRFYDLEERAEEWHAQGRLSLEATVDFVDFIVQSKLAFNGAASKAERLSVIDSVQARWDALVAGLE